MLPDWVSNPWPLTYQSGALLIELRSSAKDKSKKLICCLLQFLFGALRINTLSCWSSCSMTHTLLSMLPMLKLWYMYLSMQHCRALVAQ